MRSTPLSRRRQALATIPLTAAVSAALSTSALLLPSTASAQLEEVVVTARARAESLQDVPATVTAFTEGQIQNMGVERAEDFIYMTPGVTFVNTVEVGDSSLSIRGINGARDAETNFAFIVDGGGLFGEALEGRLEVGRSGDKRAERVVVLREYLRRL